MLSGVFEQYLFGVSVFAAVIAVFILISSIDDLLIDVYYWYRAAVRKWFVYRTHEPLEPAQLLAVDEKPLAIMVPAWQEVGVVGPMAELAARTLDYENYHIFVGTYPNDPDTQADVDAVCAKYPHVHKVICARPGPTSKADCLNNILSAMFQFESDANLEFSGFILHDAEDVLSAMELRLFNYLVDRKDLIQLPVYPFVRKWYEFTSGHYMDEFAELHGKDVRVRESFAGQVPSAGVGTCFSRRAILALLEDGDGIAFDVQSLTEDYDIGFRLKEKGMEEIFVRFPVIPEDYCAKDVPLSERMLRRKKDANVICIREYFPSTFTTAVRQKSRWICGIVYQGSKTLRWSDDWKLNYFLVRDRKGAFTNFVSFFANIVGLHLLILWAYHAIASEPVDFTASFYQADWFFTILWINLGLLVNRALQRAIFVSRYYGVKQGFLSTPRMLWGNIINFCANARAIKQIIEIGDSRRVAWDKTSHDFPEVGETQRSTQPLGQILIDIGALDTEQVTDALIQQQMKKRPLGKVLLDSHLVSAETLGRAIAIQADVEFANVNTMDTDDETLAAIAPSLALRYAVIPLALEDNHVILASEQPLTPVALNAIARKTGYSVEYRIVACGQVAAVLRYRYAHVKVTSPYDTLQDLKTQQDLSSQDVFAIWQLFVQKQRSITDIFLQAGTFKNAVLASALIGYEKSSLPLGEYLVQKGLISQETLSSALREQAATQPRLEEVVADYFGRELLMMPAVSS
ncbi:glycosyl transferase family protein [Algicola sagamiensis]|uniref:glycosyl transferase family protein n=1 Tax=Algicola sagamiensis TaxID=163869 RepID=UPI00035F168C|nr:glycosyl transferase family protein [Algicola sagamiensis]